MEVVCEQSSRSSRLKDDERLLMDDCSIIGAWSYGSGCENVVGLSL